jgi:thiol-disulfide isomerase/thioredoxin
MLKLATLVFLATSVLSRRAVDPTAYRPRNLRKVDWYNHESMVQAPGFNWVLFGATWCPHTQDAIPIFDQVAQYYTRVNGYPINYMYCYVDEPRSWDYWKPETVGIRATYNVTVYPNIRMYYNGDYMHRFKSKRTMAKFQKYVNKVVPIIMDHVHSDAYVPGN